MILGMTAFTFVHVALSLVGIFAGLVVLYGMLTSHRMPTWTALFLVTTLATTLTGFGFPFQGFTPAIGVGIVSTLILAATLVARYAFRLSGAWRWIYIVGAVTALYLNVFVLVVQSFQKIPALHVFAPQGSEPPFAITQAIVLVLFIAAGFLTARRFHPVVDQRTLTPMSSSSTT
jgi:hypothetical protein